MFSQAVIDISDCHTILGGLGQANTPLAMGTEQDYAKLSHQITQDKPVEYGLIAGRSGTIIKTLEPSSRKEKYWLYLSRSDNPLIFHQVAWKLLLPIQARPAIRVNCRPKPACKVRVDPSVLLFPFGWSTCLSLKVTGQFDLVALSCVVQQVCQEKVFYVGDEVPADQTPSESRMMTLTPVLSSFSEGIRRDAFLGEESLDFRHFSPTVVTTVIDAGGDLVAWRGLVGDRKAAVWRIIDPEGEHPADPLDDRIFELERDNPNHNFLAYGEDSAFIWLHKLLNHQKGTRKAKCLRCYHNNTSRSMTAARQYASLLITVASETEPLTPTVRELAERACDLLGKIKPSTETNEKETYVCASQLEFTRRPLVQAAISRAKTILEPKGSPAVEKSSDGSPKKPDGGN